jgi:site-specific DNA recombinase
MPPYKNYVIMEIPMMKNLLLFYRNSDGKTKKKILSCIFSEKVVLEKGRVATTPFSVTVQVLINTSKALEVTKDNNIKPIHTRY